MKTNPANSWQIKSLVILPTLLITAHGAFAQSQAKVEILKLHWEKQIRLPRNYDPAVLSNGVVYNDPTARTSSNSANPQDLTRIATSNQHAAAGTSSDFPNTPARLPVVYVYSMKVKNTGDKSIQGITWDYLFIDPKTNTELGRHRFLSYEKVAADKSVTLQNQLRSPPTRVVQASSPKTTRGKYIERAVIQCVLYTDNSTWQNPRAQSDICSSLKNGTPPMRRKTAAARLQFIQP